MRVIGFLISSLLLIGCAEDSPKKRTVAASEDAVAIDGEEIADEEDTEPKVDFEDKESLSDADSTGDEEPSNEEVETITEEELEVVDSELADALKNTDGGTPTLLEDGYLDEENLVQVFQLFSPQSEDHMLSLNVNEASQLGYSNNNMIKFALLKEPVPGHEIGLYRCNVNGNHFASTASDCEGFKMESLLGYFLPPDSLKGEPLARCYTVGDHFVFFDASKCMAPAKNEGVFGKVLKVAL